MDIIQIIVGLPILCLIFGFLLTVFWLEVKIKDLTLIDVFKVGFYAILAVVMLGALITNVFT